MPLIKAPARAATCGAHGKNSGRIEKNNDKLKEPHKQTVSKKKVLGLFGNDAICLGFTKEEKLV